MMKISRDRAIKVLVWCLGLTLLILPQVVECPENLDPRGFRALGVTALMAVLWVSEVLPIPVTSILPILLFPLLGIMPSDAVSGAYANDLTFLFFGGFFMALTIEKWKLHRRIALNLIVLFGTQPARTMLGIMVAVAVLSMWISNTATTLMMLPICIALCEELSGSGVNDETRVRFTTALLLSVAYAANIGGMGTPIGTAPNGIFQREFEGAGQPSFAEWMIICVPLVCIFVVIVWLVLRREFSKASGEICFGDRDLVRDRLKKLGGLSTQEKAVAAVFGLVVLLWVTRRDLTLGSFYLPGWVSGLEYLGADWLVASAKTGVGDSAAAILGVVLLCIWRPGPDKAVLADWDTAKSLPWGMLLLLGGGFAIAKSFQIGASAGDILSLSAWIGNSLSSLESAGAPVLVPVISTVMSFMTEFASNTATTSVVVPIVSQVGTDTLGRLLAFAATLSASCAFMLPVATPPNAIVFASGRISIKSMIRAGLIINFIGILLISLTVLLIAANVLPKL
ncbi:MAG: sodium-dependent dicarboxylate transporter 2/3/5 [Planctomycetota bacterium]|jgi:sodium-dependent dicarboxylate transporter 2/3/5